MLDIIETIQQLTNIPSPTGYTAEIIGFLEKKQKKRDISLNGIIKEA